MNVLLIWASPNADGLTAAAAKELQKGMETAGISPEMLHLNKQSIKHCLACKDGWGDCKAKGACVIEDDFAMIYEKMKDADGILFVTPVYWHDLAENLKSFLDRLRRCETAHNHFLVGKKCLIVACAGGTGLGAIECLHNLEQTLSHMKMSVADRLPVIRVNRAYMLPALAQAGAVFVKELKK